MTPTQAAKAMRAEAERRAEIHTLGMNREHSKRLIAAIRSIPLPTEAAEPGAAEAALACGHHASLAVRNIESAVVFCELCEARDELRDAVTMERSLSNDVRTLRADLARMKSALEIAREALEPFANEADCYDSEWSDNVVAKDFRHIAIGSLRCAASALTAITAALQEPTNANG